MSAASVRTSGRRDIVQELFELVMHGKLFQLFLFTAFLFNQENSIRMAAMCCLTVGAAAWRWSVSM